MHPIYAAALPFAVSCYLATLPCPSAFAPTWTVQPLDSAGLEDFSHFGRAVDVSRRTLAVGGRDGGLGNPGFVRLYERQSTAGAEWVEHDVLTASNTGPFDSFGDAVAVCQDVLVVGAPLQSSGGAAYVFMRNTTGGGWAEVAKFVASAPVTNLGVSVAAAADVVLLGTSTDAPFAKNAGSVQSYFRTGPGSQSSWIQGPTLTAATPTLHGFYGVSVATDGEIAVVGSLLSASGPVAFAGSVDVYRRDRAGTSDPADDGWALEATLMASDATTSATHGKFRSRGTGVGDQCRLMIHGGCSLARRAEAPSRDRSASAR
jgi:hypothetical protein